MIDTIQEKGISVILCCYNSAARISKTLQSLACQQLIETHPYEVVLVNNNSSDNTAAVAASEWKSYNTEVPLRIVDEPVAGLMHARKKGMDVAAYDFLVFCDDDNWLSAQYLKTALALLFQDNSIAACGGQGIPVFDSSKPDWFDEYAEAFASGPQSVRNSNGRLLCLYGAGLTIRKKAVQDLYRKGFHSVLTGRKAGALSSGEDTELTNALVLAGYRLVYSPDLFFYHYMPAPRMNTGYLRRLFLSFGQEGPVRNLYHAYLEPAGPHRWMKNWSLHVTAALIRMLKYLLVPPKQSARKIYFLWSLAYLKSLWKLRAAYPHIRKNIERICDQASLQRPVEINVLSVLISGHDCSIPRYR
ncbi:MAG: glycosyltransferase family 2 protein [Chitinophagaceae bacterium]|nr:glycosyltransferase family 2 protein [Chitinophagaceae bacterium]